MTDIIHFKKEGLFTRFGAKYTKIDKSIFYYLHHSLQIEADFSVSHLMEILKEHETEVNLAFMAYTRGFEIAPFYEEMHLPLENPKEKPINRLEFAWTSDIYNLNEFGKPKYEIAEYVHITGKKKNDKERYGISFSPLNELKTATFKLNTEIEYKRIELGDIWEEDRKPKTKLFLKGVKEYTFGDIVGTFLNEITFDGYPHHRNERIAELEIRAEESKTEKGTPWEVIQLEWKEKELKEWTKKEGKTKALKIEKLQKEIAFLKEKMAKLK